jgi:hypothetical protein
VRIAIHIDSATTDEMRALQGAYHQGMKNAERPGNSGLWDYGTAIAVQSIGGSSWTATTPKMPAAEAQFVMREFADRLQARQAKGTP